MTVQEKDQMIAEMIRGKSAETAAINQQVADTIARTNAAIESVRNVKPSEEALENIRKNASVAHDISEQVRDTIASQNAAIEAARSIKVVL